MNCGNKIMHALKRKDVYIFSKSVKTLPEKEKVWVLLPNDYHEINNGNGDVMYKIKECIDDFEYEIDDEKTGRKRRVIINDNSIENACELAGHNMLVTSELKMSAQEIYTAYHNLLRIEESFRIMKSELDARPVYLQKEETITGHFLICYLAVLLTRLLQFKVLENKYCSEEIFSFVRDFRVAKTSD